MLVIRGLCYTEPVDQAARDHFLCGDVGGCFGVDVARESESGAVSLVQLFQYFVTSTSSG